MPLAQLVYVSRRTKNLKPEDFPALVSKSSKNNARMDVTGVLICLGQNILQVLEGDPEQITPLYEHIAKDQRHSHVQMLICKNVAKRMFPEWGMALADFNCKTDLNRDRLQALVNDIRQASDTSHHSVETRVILSDFKLQLSRAA